MDRDQVIEDAPEGSGPPDAPAGAVERTARGGTCTGSVLLAAGSAGWLLFTAAHLLLSGRVWWWVLPDLLPPPAFVLAPLLSLAALAVVAAVRRPPWRWPAWMTLGCSLVALLAGGPESGLNPAAVLGTPRPVPAGAIRVASWDTLFWDQTDDPQHFLDYLKALDADVYLLQEYMLQGPDGPVPVDDAARLRARFPGYTLVARGELLTLTRLPVVGQRVLTARPASSPTTPTSWTDYWDARVLRTDLALDGGTLSVYNVHLADPFDLGRSPLTGDFYSAAHLLGTYREAQWQALERDLAANDRPTVVSGALNTLPNMGDLRHLRSLRDAVAADTDSLYPVSFALRGAWWWRLDATYTSPEVVVSRYALRSPEGLSTHRAQLAWISLRGG